jgi:hypothetical protein
MKTIQALLVVASTSLLLSAAAHAAPFASANCEQAYSYSGGYTLLADADLALANTLHLTVSRAPGPDGDGDFIQTFTFDATAAAANGTAESSAYDSPFGTISFDSSTGSALYIDAKGTKNNLACTFTKSTTTPVSAAAALNACASAFTALDADIVTLDEHKVTLHGFAEATYSEGVPTRASIVLETNSKVYFYSENSDISATLYACDMSSGKISEYTNGHSLSCEDLPTVDAHNVIYSDCGQN